MAYPYKWSSISYKSSAGQRKPKTNALPLDHAANWARLEEVDAFLDGGCTDVTRRRDAGGRAVLATAVTALEDDRAYVALTQRTVDAVCQRLAGRR